MDKQKIGIRVFGSNYIVYSSEERIKIEKIASFVDEKMVEFSKKNAPVSAKDVAIYTSLNITGEYFNLKEEFSQLEKLVEDLQKEVADKTALYEQAKKNFETFKNENDILKNESKELAGIIKDYEKKLEEKKDKQIYFGPAIETSGENLLQKEDSDQTPEKQIESLKIRIKELETSLFEVQNENLKLRDEKDI